MKTYQSPRKLLAEVAQVLAAKPASGRREHPLQRVTGLLQNGRHYLWTSIYLLTGEELTRAASSGPETGCTSVALGSGIVGKVAQSGESRLAHDVSRDPDYRDSLPATRSELAVPIKIAGRVLGALNAENATENSFSGEDLVLLEQVAAQLASFLTGRGKYVLRHLRESAAHGGTLKPGVGLSGTKPAGPLLKPRAGWSGTAKLAQSARRPDTRRAAAGDKFHP